MVAGSGVFVEPRQAVVVGCRARGFDRGLVFRGLQHDGARGDLAGLNGVSGARRIGSGHTSVSQGGTKQCEADSTYGLSAQDVLEGLIISSQEPASVYQALLVIGRSRRYNIANLLLQLTDCC